MTRDIPHRTVKGNGNSAYKDYVLNLSGSGTEVRPMAERGAASQTKEGEGANSDGTVSKGTPSFSNVVKNGNSNATSGNQHINGGAVGGTVNKGSTNLPRGGELATSLTATDGGQQQQQQQQ